MECASAHMNSAVLSARSVGWKLSRSTVFCGSRDRIASDYISAHNLDSYQTAVFKHLCLAGLSLETRANGRPDSSSVHARHGTKHHTSLVHRFDELAGANTLSTVTSRICWKSGAARWKKQSEAHVGTKG